MKVILLLLTILLSGCTAAKIEKAQSAWRPGNGYNEEFTYERVGGKRFVREQVLYGTNGKRAYTLSWNESVVTFTRYSEDGETVLSKNNYTTFQLAQKFESLQGPLYLFPIVSKTARGLVRVDYHKHTGKTLETMPEATVYFSPDGQKADPFSDIRVGADEESVLAVLGPPSNVWKDEYFRRTEYRTPTHLIRYQWKLDDPKTLHSVSSSLRYE